MPWATPAMTGTDLLLAGIGISAFLGLMRGFIGVLASLVKWVRAGWTAFRFDGQIYRASATSSRR